MVNLRFLLTASSFVVLLQPIVATAQTECDSSNFWMTEDGVCINLDNWQRQTFAEFQQRESARREWLLNNPFVFEMEVRSIREGGEVNRDEGRLIVTIQNRSYEDLYLEWIAVTFEQRDRLIGSADIEVGAIVPARDELQFEFKMDLPAAARSPYGITPEVVDGAYYLY